MQGRTGTADTASLLCRQKSSRLIVIQKGEIREKENSKKPGSPDGCGDDSSHVFRHRDPGGTGSG